MLPVRPIRAESNRGWCRQRLGVLALAAISATGSQNIRIQSGVIQSTGEVIRIAGPSTLKPEGGLKGSTRWLLQRGQPAPAVLPGA